MTSSPPRSRNADEPRASDRRLAELRLEQLTREQRRRNAHASFEAFVLAVYPRYFVNWHHRVLMRVLQDYALGRIPRLMVFMPPRHGKSFLVSEFLPAWMLGLDPDLAVMSASYAAQLAWKFNRKLQRLMQSKVYREIFPDTRVSAKRVVTDARGNYLANKEEFEVIGREGAYKCAGVGGGITGRGFMRGIIDDPVKDRAEAESAIVREGVADWYDSTFWTRQEGDGAGILLTMTRWHEDDLAGRLLKAARDGEGERWHVLWFPAKREEDLPPELADNPGVTLLGQDEDRREESQGLWLWKFGQDFYDKAEKKSERDWLSLYQNRPRSEEGAIFKRHMLQPCLREGSGLDATFTLPTGHVVPAAECLRFLTVDTATSAKETADYTAAGAFYGHPGTRALIWVDLLRERVEGGQHEAAIEGVRLENLCSYAAIEKQHIGLAVIQALRRRGLPVREIDAGKGDKYVRAHAAMAFFEGLSFYYATDLPQKAVALEELLSFRPGSAHDDIADVVVYAALHWQSLLITAANVTPPAPSATLPDRRERVLRTVKPPRPRR